MIEAISILLAQHATELINANADGIADELKRAEEGKLSVSLSFKVTLLGDRLYSAASLAYSRKFHDEIEGNVEIEDPKQPKLKLGKDAQ
jgi:hypothetical protein